MDIKDIILILLAVIIVLVVVVFQYRSFRETRQKIKSLVNLFPTNNNLHILHSIITPNEINSDDDLKKFLNNPRDDSQEVDDGSRIDLIKPNPTFSALFKEVVTETNAYLCKNIGTSAEFEIIKDVCERKIDAVESQIQNSVNVPLYLGLAGTFIGIIFGLGGIIFNIESLFEGNLASDSIRTLLIGVVIAMIASLAGLGMMTWNSAIEYKEARRRCDLGKNNYFDFIRRELMPSLSNSMASGLNALKNVLGEFVGNFGSNLSQYNASAELLNDNIEKQHLLLVEVNKMNQTKMANTLAKTFMDISHASESFESFKSYQVELSQTVHKLTDAISRMDALISRYDNFNESLRIVVNNQEVASQLQTSFQAAIERHFPIGSDAREQWRKPFDELTSDAIAVSNELNNQLLASTQHIQNFVEENKNLFDSVSSLREVSESLVQYTNVQAECYKDLKKSIDDLMENQAKNQSAQASLNADLLIAVREMISAVKSIKN